MLQEFHPPSNSDVYTTVLTLENISARETQDAIVVFLGQAGAKERKTSVGSVYQTKSFVPARVFPSGRLVTESSRRERIVLSESCGRSRLCPATSGIRNHSHNIPSVSYRSPLGSSHQFCSSIPLIPLKRAYLAAFGTFRIPPPKTASNHLNVCSR